jgi:hypothetical protein
MDRLSKLKEELAYLEQRLPELEERPELDRLVSEFKKQMAAIHHTGWVISRRATGRFSTSASTAWLSP